MGHDSWPKLTRRPRLAYDIAAPNVSICVCGCNCRGKVASTIRTFEVVIVGHYRGIYGYSCQLFKIIIS
jgi:hypothetical protein